MKTEVGALRLSAATAITVGCVGVVFSLLTNSQAILLDGLFSLAYFITALLTLKVARIVSQPDDEDYPLGYSYFVPLVNGFKGVLILGISMLALADGLSALLKGGRLVEVGPAIVYGIIATLACTSTAVLLRRAHRRTASPLVDVDASSWTVDAAISSAVLLTFCAIPVVNAMGGAALVPYVDPFLVSVIVVISLGIPIRMAWSALMAMLNRAPPREIRDPIDATIRDALADLPSRSVYIRIIRPGGTLLVTAHVVLPDDFPITGLDAFDAVRARVEANVRRVHGPAIVDVLFTADEKWAAPVKAPDADATTESGA